MPALVIIGAQWGDEGKGKIVDLLAREADVVARFQGGPNAGHTLVVGKKKTVLHHIPSGILHSGKINALGPGMLVDPNTCLDEVIGLRDANVKVVSANLIIDARTHLILPMHRALDAAREGVVGGIGTTKRGMSTCNQARIGYRGVRFCDLLSGSRDAFTRLESSVSEYNALMQFYGAEGTSAEDQLDQVMPAVKGLSEFVGDTCALVRDAIAGDQRVLFEGAQGTFLDPIHGTYPFVTTTPCVAGAVYSSFGLPLRMRIKVLGILKAYTTRVGKGPFPAEIHGDGAQKLREVGAEYGATTGRDRRVGWLDLYMTQIAHAANGFDMVAVTKLDVISFFEKLFVVTRDSSGGLPNDYFKTGVPHLQEVQGWLEDISSCADWSAGPHDWRVLPHLAREYLNLIRDVTGIHRIPLISVGPDRNQTLHVGSVWS